MSVIRYTNDTKKPCQTKAKIDASADAMMEFGETSFDILSMLEAHIQKPREKTQKFSLGKPKTHNFFLPSFYQCSECIMGMPFNKLIEFMEEQQGRKLRISRNSRSAMFNKGVGNPTAKKFIEWLKPVIAKFSREIDLRTTEIFKRGAVDTSTSGDWLCLMAGIRTSESFHDPYVISEYYPLFVFLEERCDINIEMIKVIKGRVDSGAICSESSAEVFSAMRTYWQNCTEIPDSAFENYQRSLFLYEDGRFDDECKLSLFKSYFHLHFDFFFNLFSSYEVGCVITYTPNRDELKTKNGILCRSITRFVKKSKLEKYNLTCFGELLEEIRDVISKINKEHHCKELSKREMSMSLPMALDQTNPSEESDADRYYKKFKSWQSGREFPTMPSVERFLDNLTKEFGQAINTQITLLCMMAIWLDKEIRKWCEALSKSKDIDTVEPIMDGLLAAIGRYEVYYHHHLQKHINRKAGV
ncbi:hypothetical protein K0J45_09305 [Shewanella alkalitolerans]|uniref:hypothetical protein n=1 Tax=Shewanella alkalitolerans TaxID=2864209 RepID=UPI001C65E383|nr:hypothetical protein [Shewanella alkalitolerans]QYJ99365.1 hypothetical protein K0J45_09305 [Shewanella alkalitolerans]